MLFFASVTFFGLGIAGLSTRNCEKLCQASEVSAGGDCIDECFNITIQDQPESLRLYIRCVMGLLVPFAELCAAFYAYTFPIKGTRLRRLYHQVSRSRGEDPSTTSAEADADLPAHQARSRIVLWLDEPEWLNDAGWATRLAHTNALVIGRPGKKSVSVLFDSVCSGAELSSVGSGTGGPGVSTDDRGEAII